MKWTFLSSSLLRSLYNEPLTPSSNPSLSPGGSPLREGPLERSTLPSPADWSEFINASNSKVERDLAQLTLSDPEQRELYEAARLVQTAFRKYKVQAWCSGAICCVYCSPQWWVCTVRTGVIRWFCFWLLKRCWRFHFDLVYSSKCRSSDLYSKVQGCDVLFLITHFPISISVSFSVPLLIYTWQQKQKIYKCPCGFSMGRWLEQSMALLRGTTALSPVSLLQLDMIKLMFSSLSLFPSLFLSLSLS